MIRRNACWAGVFACLILPTASTTAAVQPGNLILSEFMADPVSLSDTQGEWLELFNTTPGDIDLRGMTLSDDGSNLHVISAANPVVAPGRGYVLLGRSGSIDGTGQIVVDYVYGGFTLNNTSDQIVLSQGAQELLRLDYTAAMVAPGRSTELRELTAGGPVYAFAPITLSYDGGANMGTPGGAPNSQPILVAPVPLPPAASLFLTALAVVFGGNFANRSRSAGGLETLPA